MQEFDPHVLDEKPVPPPEEFSKRAHVKSLDEYREMYERALQRSRRFLGASRPRCSIGSSRPQSTLEWNLPHAKWFVGGKLNVSYNCLDRHLARKRQQARAALGSRGRRQARVHLRRTSPSACAASRMR